MTSKPTGRVRKVKCWAAINNYDGNLIAYGKRDEDWSHAIFPHKNMIKNVNNTVEDVEYTLVPCTIEYSLPTPKKKGN